MALSSRNLQLEEIQEVTKPMLNEMIFKVGN